MTMTSDKNFIAGTAGASNTLSLLVVQKVVTGTSYSNIDVQSKSFVFHQLAVGSNNEWRYGAGATDGNGVITMTSETGSGANNNAITLTGTISVNSSGVVAISGYSSFNGFLSDDKKTIVGTYTGTDGKYRLMIIQITGKTHTFPEGISASHLLTASAAPFWMHYTFNSQSTSSTKGTMTVINSVSSNPLLDLAKLQVTYTFDSNGTITIPATFHGQLSDDQKFIVATETWDDGCTLVVTTR